MLHTVAPLSSDYKFYSQGHVLGLGFGPLNMIKVHMAETKNDLWPNMVWNRVGIYCNFIVGRPKSIYHELWMYIMGGKGLWVTSKLRLSYDVLKKTFTWKFLLWTAVYQHPEWFVGNERGGKSYCEVTKENFRGLRRWSPKLIEKSPGYLYRLVAVNVLFRHRVECWPTDFFPERLGKHTALYILNTLRYTHYVGRFSIQSVIILDCHFWARFFNENGNGIKWLTLSYWTPPTTLKNFSSIHCCTFLWHETASTLSDTPNHDRKASMLSEATFTYLFEPWAQQAAAIERRNNVWLYSTFRITSKVICVNASNLQDIRICKGFHCRNDENCLSKRPTRVVCGRLRSVVSLHLMKYFTTEIRRDRSLSNCVCKEVIDAISMRKAVAPNIWTGWRCSGCWKLAYFPVDHFCCEGLFLYPSMSRRSAHRVKNAFMAYMRYISKFFVDHLWKTQEGVELQRNIFWFCLFAECSLWQEWDIYMIDIVKRIIVLYLRLIFQVCIRQCSCVCIRFYNIGDACLIWN